MDLKINESQTGHLMTDLGISQDRCVELCGAIEESIYDLHNEGKDKVTLAQVAQKALTHAKDDAEVVFISITAGEYHAEYMRHVAGMQMPDVLKELFSQTRSRASVFN